MSILNHLIFGKCIYYYSKVLKQFKKQRALWVVSMTTRCYELNCGISFQNLEPQNKPVVEMRPLRRLGRLHEVVRAPDHVQLVTLYMKRKLLQRLHRHSSGKEHVTNKGEERRLQAFC